MDVLRFLYIGLLIAKALSSKSWLYVAGKNNQLNASKQDNSSEDKYARIVSFQIMVRRRLER